MFKKNITIEDKALFEEYINSYPYQTSGLTFTSLFMWRQLNEFKYEIINDFLCISGINHLDIENKEHFVLPPLAIGNYDLKKLALTIDVLKDRFNEARYPFKIKLLPNSLIQTFQDAKPNELSFTSDRANYDYVYLKKDLVELKGRTYHSKKNHLNYFIKNTPYEYFSLTSDHINDCIEFNKQLIEAREYTSFEAHLIDLEQSAVYEALKNMDTLGCRGGIIFIDNKVEAFTLGAKLNQNTMVVHIEKANMKFRGLYQAINQQFCKIECSNVEYINREEDMGLPNLRKAKLSYRPIKMIEKYDVTLCEPISQS